MKTQFSWATPTGTHGEYADEQLANLQKRIWLIEFLRLGLIIGWQGAMLALPKIKTTFWVVFIFVKTSQLDEFFDFYYCAPNWGAVKTHKKH